MQILYLSSMQYRGIRTFWTKKVTQEKLTKITEFTKYFELYHMTEEI